MTSGVAKAPIPCLTAIFSAALTSSDCATLHHMVEYMQVSTPAWYCKCVHAMEKPVETQHSTCQGTPQKVVAHPSMSVTKA